MNKFLIPVLGLTLVSCATGFQPQTAIDSPPFNASHENGMVAVSLESDAGFYALNFAKIDPETCHVTETLSYSDRSYKRGVSGDTHIVDSFEPGVWVVGGTTFVDGYQKTITRFENYAYAFRVKPGEFIHLGKLLLKIGESTIEDPDGESLKAYITEHMNITTEPTPVSPWLTPYSHDQEIPVAGCNPLPEEHV